MRAPDLAFAMGLIAEPKASAHLVALDGTLVEFGFEPGRTEVKVRAMSGELLTFSASIEQVELALGLRLAVVQVLAVADAQKHRLLRISEQPPLAPTEEERSAYLFKTWGSLLTRLAQ